jgi:hypothetical protein
MRRLSALSSRHRMIRGSAGLLGVTLALLAFGSLRAQVPQRLPLVIHLAQVAGAPVVPRQFVEERIARANQIYAPYGVGFAIQRWVALDAVHARLEARGDRDALGAAVQARVINCFVVESLRDVDEPERMRRGVHWHSQTFAGAHFVILSAIAGPDVLAHELGHFLGNPEHSHTPGNLMSYERGEGDPVLDEAQLVRMRRAIRGYLRRRELDAVP